MTRFDAATTEERRSLIADAVAAHRERESLFCTFEADESPAGGRAGTGADDESDDGADADHGGESAPSTHGGDEATEEPTPTPAWIQFSEREGQLNLDCTDEEYDAITDVLADFPAFTVVEQSSPEDAEGRNLRVEAWADDERIAELVDRLFVDGFGYGDDVRVWATEL